MPPLPSVIPAPGGSSYVVIILLLMLGGICYAFAHYSGLLLGDGWTLMKSLAISIPIVIVEYAFVLSATKMAKDNGSSVMQTFLLIMCMNFIGVFGYSKLVINDPVNFKDVLAFGLVAGAFGLSYDPHEKKIPALSGSKDTS